MEVLMYRRSRMTKAQRAEWTPILAAAVEQCRRHAQQATPQRGECFVMDPEALDRAAHQLARIMGWDNGQPLNRALLELIIQQDVRPRVRAACIDAGRSQGEPEVRERPNAWREAGSAWGRMLLNAVARGI